MTTAADVHRVLAVLMAAYPMAEKQDREAMRRFADLAALTLQAYHPRILEQMIHPELGLIARCKFLPSIAEMKEFCERIAQREWEIERKDKARETQLTYRPEARETERDRIKQGFRDLLREIGVAPDIRNS